MDVERQIYSLNIEDIFTVLEDTDIDLELEESDILFIEDKVGDMIDWRSAIETALRELKGRKAEKV